MKCSFSQLFFPPLHFSPFIFPCIGTVLPESVRLLEILWNLDSAKMSNSQIFRCPSLFIVICLIDGFCHLHHRCI